MNKKVLIGMPSATGCPSGYLSEYLFGASLPTDKDGALVHTGYKVMSRQDICKSRNDLLSLAIRLDYDYVWFLDDDNPPEQLDALKILLSYNVDFITGLVPTRNPIEGKYKIVTFEKKINEYGFHNYEMADGVQDEEVKEVDACGMGCCLISRRVIERLYRQYIGCPFEMRNMRYYMDGDKILSDDDDRNKTININTRYCRFNSEGILFSERAKREGFSIHATKLVTCKHLSEPELVSIQTHILDRNIEE